MKSISSIPNTNVRQSWNLSLSSKSKPFNKDSHTETSDFNFNLKTNSDK